MSQECVFGFWKMIAARLLLQRPTGPRPAKILRNKSDFPDRQKDELFLPFHRPESAFRHARFRAFTGLCGGIERTGGKSTALKKN
jgi:hypothetical protein